MYVSDGWEDYALLDATEGERLERWGGVVLVRPDPQVLWRTPRVHDGWSRCDGRYIRSSGGGGHWQWRGTPPGAWHMRYRTLSFRVKPTDFKHTGLFPEQAYNWDKIADLIRARTRPTRVLNLFAYTGGATLAAAAAGAQVTHVDAAKGMVAWARENAALSRLDDRPIRWLVDDCVKFAEREFKRGRRYDAIILDPPSYGRGPGGEVWKLEEKLHDFLLSCHRLMSDDPCFVLLNTYTTGLSPSVMKILLSSTFRHFTVECGELGLPAESGLILPSGAAALALPETPGC